MIKIAIHQANFVPWYPFFYKMAMADKFVILQNVQFEKNGYQNRYMSKGAWVTKPVKSGLERIVDKEYTDGTNVAHINYLWINAIKQTLNIDTDIVFDYPTTLTKTERLIDLIKNYSGNVYVTNPEAKDKYLDEELMRRSGIDIEYCAVPKHLQRHTFEIFEEYGIEGAIKQLPKKVRNEVLAAIV